VTRRWLGGSIQHVVDPRTGAGHNHLLEGRRTAGVLHRRHDGQICSATEAWCDSWKVAQGQIKKKSSDHEFLDVKSQRTFSGTENALVFVVPNDAIDAFRLDSTHNIENYWKNNCHGSEGCQHPNALCCTTLEIPSVIRNNPNSEQKDTP
jgi:hypothetical protein